MRRIPWQNVLFFAQFVHLALSIGVSLAFSASVAVGQDEPTESLNIVIQEDDGLAEELPAPSITTVEPPENWSTEAPFNTPWTPMDADFWLRYESEGYGYERTTSAGFRRHLPTSSGAGFLTGQFIVDEQAHFSANVGTGHRWLDCQGVALGGNAFYDLRQSEYDNTFHQLGVGVELLSHDWEARVNGYFALGDAEQDTGILFGQPGDDPYYLGNNIADGEGRLREVMLEGLDVELAHRYAASNTWVYAGYYHYDRAEPVDGVRAGLRGSVSPALEVDVSVAHDKLFETNLIASATWFIGRRGARDCWPNTMLRQRVRRQQNIVLIERIDDPVQLLTDPSGDLITVMHVNSDAGAASDPAATEGTVENPFDTLTAADAAPDKADFDIVLLHADSVFSGESFALAADQRLLGERLSHTVDTLQLGTITLPRATTGTANPLIEDAPADALTAAAGSEISAVRINRAGGAAIRVDMLAAGEAVDINRVNTNRGARGLHITDSDGTVALTDVLLRRASDAALVVDGGNVDVTVDLNSSINQDGGGGSALAVRSTSSPHTGILTFDAGSTIDAIVGDGLQFDDADGEYDFNGTTSLNGGDAGIDILGGSDGTFTFGVNTTIDSNGLIGPALRIDGGSAQVTYNGGIAINSGDAVAAVSIEAGHAAGTNDAVVTFQSGSINAADGTGLQFDNADGEYFFNGITSLNGGDAGIDILGGSDGTFTFGVNTTIDSNGLIGPALHIDGGSAQVTYNGDITINNGDAVAAVSIEGGHAVGTNDAVVIFQTGLMIASDGTGLQFDNADGDYSFNSIVSLNGGDAGIDILGGSGGSFTFAAGTSITNPTGDALNIQDLAASATVDYQGGIATNAAGSDLINIDTTAAGSQITIAGANKNATNAGGIRIIDSDGDVDIQSGANLNGSDIGVFVSGGGGETSLNDIAITNHTASPTAVRVDGQMGTVSFNDLTISTNSNSVIGFAATSSNRVEVTGASQVNSTGGNAVLLDGLADIDMQFNSLTSTNALGGGLDATGVGVRAVDVASGSFNVTGATTVNGAAGQGIFIDDSAATFNFASVNIDGTGAEGVLLGETAGNLGGLVAINGGTIDGVGAAGVRANNTALNLNGVIIGGTTVPSGPAVDLLVSLAAADLRVNLTSNTLNAGGGVTDNPGLNAVTTAGTLCLNAINNTVAANGATFSDIELTETGGMLGITQASTAAMSAANNGATVDDNATAIDFNCP